MRAEKSRFVLPFSRFEQVQRSAIRAAAHVRSRGSTSKPRAHLSCLASLTACATGFGEESRPDPSTNAKFLALTAALVMAGAALGVSHCQVSTDIVAPAVGTAHDCCETELVVPRSSQQYGS